MAGILAEYEIISKMSLRDQILNLFYQAPNYEKVLERFALVIEDDLREYYEIELKKKESKVLTIL
jgi:hypothetical protein